MTVTAGPSVAPAGALATMRVRDDAGHGRGFLVGWFRHAGLDVPDRIDPATIPRPWRFMLEPCPQRFDGCPTCGDRRAELVVVPGRFSCDRCGVTPGPAHPDPGLPPGVDTQGALF